MAPSRTPVASADVRPRRAALFWWIAGCAGLLGFAALRVASVSRTAVHWDEFALLARADRILETGFFDSGGRPGLAVLLLVPFLGECLDELAVIQSARFVWLALTSAYLLGLAALVVQMQPDRSLRLRDALLGVALLGLLPVFLETSLQVRTDQIALAFGVWGGVALLAGQRRQRLVTQAACGALAGMLFAVGYLATQKLIYVVALCGVLALGRLALAREFRISREAVRALGCAASFLAVFSLYAATLESSLELPETHASQTVVSAKVVENGLELFDLYRNTIGYDQYRSLLPSLGPHFVLLAALLAGSVVAMRRRLRADSLWLAWALLATGFAVGAFHAAAFSYFWMTLGLFPAIAFAVARGRLAELLMPADPRGRALLATAFWIALVGPGVAALALLNDDTQAVQRDTLRFVHRNFDRDVAGFHPESGPFCQSGTPPIGTYFSQTIYREFGVSEERRDRRVAQFLKQHRETPIAFLVDSFRLNQFPSELRRFWADNYQPYFASVFVAGRRLGGEHGSQQDFELIVPGLYRWLPFEGREPLEISRTDMPEPRALAAGEIIDLARGEYTAHFAKDTAGGLLVLAMNDPPGPAPQQFYKDY